MSFFIYDACHTEDRSNLGNRPAIQRFETRGQVDAFLDKQLERLKRSPLFSRRSDLDEIYLVIEGHEVPITDV